jgi:hypothetical protein
MDENSILDLDEFDNRIKNKKFNNSKTF